MPSATELKIAELTKGMLRLKLFVIFSYGKGLDLKPTLPDHLAYMVDLERQGKLFASGPFGDGTKGDGMTIVRAANEDEALARSFRHQRHSHIHHPVLDRDGGVREPHCELLGSVRENCLVRFAEGACTCRRSVSSESERSGCRSVSI